MTVGSAAAVVAGPHTTAPPDGAAGLRLFTRGAVTPRWLCRAVLPAVRLLGEEDGADVLYLRRGWLHGPHVELVARADRGRTLRWAQAARLLDPGPPPQVEALSEASYLERAREFGRLEGVAPPYLPMRAHGTVEWVDAAQVPTWPHPLGALRELALTRICRPLVGAVRGLADEPATATQRLAEAFVAIAGAHRWGIAQGVFSLRSHAEAFLNWATPRRDPRPAFAARLREDGPMLRSLVEQSLSGNTSRQAAEWMAAFLYCIGAFDGAVAAGTLSLSVLDSLGTGFDAATMGPPGQDGAVTTGPSEFHQAVAASGVIDAPPEWFASYRLLINLFYQQLPLLGVAPMHRYYLCYAVAESVDAVLGESWQDRLGRLAALRTGGAPA